MVSLVFIIPFIFYVSISTSVNYEVLTKEEVPTHIKREIEKNIDNKKFSIFQDETNTYVYYKADKMSPNEYITTDLAVKRKGSKYVVTANVYYAVNDNYVSYEQLIKLDKISEDDIILKEHIKR